MADYDVAKDSYTARDREIKRISPRKWEPHLLNKSSAFATALAAAATAFACAASALAWAATFACASISLINVLNFTYPS